MITQEIKPKIVILNKDQEIILKWLLKEFTDLFAKDIIQLKKTNLVTYKIYTEDVPPISSQPYIVSLTEQIFINEEIQQMLDNNLITELTSLWAFLVVLVAKKNRKKRFCVDYRKLNKITKKNAYPFPRIDEMLDSLAGATYFSTLDLISRY